MAEALVYLEDELRKATMKIAFSPPYVVDAPVDVASLARLGESLGFESIWFGEHPVMPTVITSPGYAKGPTPWTGSHNITEEVRRKYNIEPEDMANREPWPAWHGSPDGAVPQWIGHMMDPFIALAQAGAVTKTLKLGTAICLVPERHPIHTAKEVATLDYLSGGRFLFGIGAGIFREEVEIMGGDFDHRWSQTREAIMAMREIWTKDVSEYHGKYYDFQPLWCYPKPLQKPHPPIILGGRTERNFRRVVDYGDGWHASRCSPEVVRAARVKLDELADKAGRDPASIEITISLGGHRFSASMPDRETLKTYEEAGTDRVVVLMPGSDVPETPTDVVASEMEKFARQVLD